MADEPENIVLRRLGEIRSVLDEQGRVLAEHKGRFDRLERQLSQLPKVVTYTLGQANETQFHEAEQEKRIDELFEKLEHLLFPKEPA